MYYINTCSTPTVSSTVITRAYIWCSCVNVTVDMDKATYTNTTSGVHSTAKSSCPSICPGRLLSSPVVDPSSQQSSTPFNQDIPIALRKGKQSCINHPISYCLLWLSYHLSPVCLVFIFYIYTQVLWGCYIDSCLKAGHGWGDWYSCFSRYMGVSFCTQRCCGLSMGLYFEVSPDGTVDWHKARLVAKILRPMEWIILRLFHQLLSWIPSRFYFLLMSICRDPCSN